MWRLKTGSKRRYHGCDQHRPRASQPGRQDWFYAHSSLWDCRARDECALTITELVKTGILTPMQMAEKMSYNPAKVLGIDRGTLREGAAADVVVIDPDAQYTINKNKFASKGRNTPFHGRKVYGEVQMTICDGEIVYEKRQNI